MAAFGHTWGDRRRETDRAAGGLGLDGAENLQDRVPGEIDISIDSLSMKLLVGTNNEAIVGVNIASLVDSMVARA